MSHFTDFTGYVLFIITSFLAGVESADKCLLNSKVLSCFSGVIVSIRSFFSTYKYRSWVWNDTDVIPIEPGNQLYYLIEKTSNLLTGSTTLFLIDNIIANETLDKCRQPLLELVISGRHWGHSLWLLTQSYTAIPNNVRRQAKMLYVWYPKT